MVVFEDLNGDGYVTSEEDPEKGEVLERFMYYAFGMKWDGIWCPVEPLDPKEEHRYQYNGKEYSKSSGLSDYGFRYYLAEIGRFTGVDPIADQFPHVSVYNYAENRVPMGIDLWGLQFLDANEAKIIITGGGIRLNSQNLSSPTRYRIAMAGVSTVTNSDGSQTISGNFPMVLSKFPKGMPREGSGIVANRPSSRPGGGNSKQRRQWSRGLAQDGLKPGKNTLIGPGSGRTGGGLPYIAGEAMNAIANYMVANDLNTAREQEELYGSRISDIISGAENEGYLSGLSHAQIGDIGNYILQGTMSGDYDNETKCCMETMAKHLMQNNNVPIKNE